MTVLNSTIKALLEQRLLHCGWVELPSSGYSMYPFIKPGDLCRFVRANLSQLRPGDVLLFGSGQQIIGHRLHRIQGGNDSRVVLICKGDTNLLPDLVEWEQVLATLESIKKPRHRLLMEGNGARLWGKLILYFPYHSQLIRAYLNARVHSRVVKKGLSNEARD